MVRMEIHELLDRFELIYQKDSISNLRRSYIDKDLHSIFKLLDEKGYDQDLKKLILFDDYYALWRLLERETKSALIPAIKKHHSILGDALSQGQIKSKQWLLSKIKGLDLGTVFICNADCNIVLPVDSNLRLPKPFMVGVATDDVDILVGSKFNVNLWLS